MKLSSLKTKNEKKKKNSPSQSYIYVSKREKHPWPTGRWGFHCVAHLG